MVNARNSGAATVVSTEPEGFVGATVARWSRTFRRLLPQLAFATVVASVIALVSRLATTITYVEDIDSLHFALSMLEFDVTAMQPHFPGYVVFVALARVASWLAGGIAGGFALVGGVATALIAVRLPKLAGYSASSPFGLLLGALVLGSGMLWLYGNRYMPDLLGVALLVWSFVDLLDERGSRRVRGAFAAALLAGTRLSYLPFLAPFAVAALAWPSHRRAALAAFVLGIALWAAPLVLTTGWDETLAVAFTQTTAHFDDHGGTVRTEPDMALRIERMASGIWSDALGGWVPGRAPATLVLGALVAVALAAAATRARELLANRRALLALAGIATYLVWIALYQNVIYHTRHLLPLVPFLLIAVAVGVEAIARRWRRLGTAFAAALIAAQAVVGTTLALQHRKPTALAQAARRVAKATPPVTVVSTALVNDYLVGNGVRARFLSVDLHAVADSLRGYRGGTVISIGDYRRQVGMSVDRVERFYHNPYVNRIWPVIEFYTYDTVAAPGGAR